MTRHTEENDPTPVLPGQCPQLLKDAGGVGPVHALTCQPPGTQELEDASKAQRPASCPAGALGRQSHWRNVSPWGRTHSPRQWVPPPPTRKGLN